MTVVNLRPGRNPPAKPPRPPLRYETVTQEERSAADALKRAADALHRLTSAPFVTPTTLAKAPELLAAAQTAVDELKELLG